MDNNSDTFERIDEIIYSYFENRTSPQEERYLLDWLRQSDSNRKYFFDIYAIYCTYGTLASSDMELRTRRFLDRINARIDAEPVHERKAGVVRRLYRWTAVAAVVAVLSVTGFFIARNYSPDEKYLSYSNTEQVVKSILLEDGSEVCLQPGALLKYSSGSRDKDVRSVILEGEAYFDVAEDKSRPFIVNAGSVLVKVLGTAFNVKASPSSAFTEVILERGAVRLMTPDGVNMISLSPNQKAVYNSDEEDLKIFNVNASRFVTRHYKLVTMENATLSEIISCIERNYGVEVICDIVDDGRTYDLNYLKDNSVEDVLKIVEYMTGGHLESVPSK